MPFEGEALKRKIFAIEHERPAVRRHFGIGPQPELGGDPRRLRIEREIELDLLDEIIGRRVVFQEFGRAGGLLHGLKDDPFALALEGGAQDAKA